MADDPISRGRTFLAAIDTKLSRAHAQTATLCTVSGGITTAGVAVLALGKLPAPATIGGWIAIALTGSAFWSLLSATRPNLTGDYGIVRWARHPEIVLEDMRDKRHEAALARDIAAESALAMIKFRANQRATDLMRAALATVAFAAVWTITETVITWLF